jgi:dihydrofolate synthase/folylpolyglutamate synthase
VRAAVDIAEPPTFFEFATAMAFLYFLQAGAAPIILETGMGGRLDATNIVQPLVSVITNISRDHQEHLGEGLLAIAGEKAGSSSPGRRWSPMPGKNRCSNCSATAARKWAPPSTRAG